MNPQPPAFGRGSFPVFPRENFRDHRNLRGVYAIGLGG